MRRILPKGWIVGAALPAVLLAACRFRTPAVPPLTVSKATTYITEPLRADGTPDFTEWLNRKYGSGVTPDNNAALVLRSGLAPGLLRQMGVDPAAAPETVAILGGLGDLAPFEEYLKTQLDTRGQVPGIGPLPADFQGAFAAQQRRASLAPWRSADAPLIEAWLRANDGRLARIEEATRTRTRYWVPIPEDLGFDTRLPSLLGFRLMGNAFRTRALGRTAQGDPVAARGDVIAGLRLAAFLDQGSWLIDRLIGVALRGIAAESIVVLANPPADPKAAGALLRELKDLPGSVALDDVIDVNERLVVLAACVDLYRAARTSHDVWEKKMASLVSVREQVAASLGQVAPTPTWRKLEPWAIDWDELLSTVNRCWQNPDCEPEITAARADLEPTALDGLLAAAGRDRPARRRIARAFLAWQESGSMRRSSVAWNEAEAILRIGLVSAAAGSHKATHGGYPSETRALEPAGFDPGADYAGYSFRYQPSPGDSGFAYTASPRRSGETGVRAFCADSSGRLSFTTDGTRPALVGGLCDPAAQTLVARTPPGVPR